jgi:hypothetical protein
VDGSEVWVRDVEVGIIALSAGRDVINQILVSILVDAVYRRGLGAAFARRNTEKAW